MRPQIMNETTVKEREDMLMEAILKSLRDLGGLASRKDIRRDIYDNSTTIPEDYITYTRTSKQTGNDYKPYDYQFNFALKYLMLANYIKYPKYGEVELTEKGRQVNVDSFNPEEVRYLMEQSMRSESDSKEEINKAIDVEEIEETRGVEEIWRSQFQEALKQMTPQNLKCLLEEL